MMAAPSSNKMSVHFSDDVQIHGGAQNNVQMYQTGMERRNPGFSSDFTSSEDEVFLDEPSSDSTVQNLTKPLMAPRQRTRVRVQGSSGRCKRCVWPMLYCLLVLASIGAVVCLALYLVHTYGPKVLQLGHFNKGYDLPSEIVGCSKIEVEDVWVVGFPKLLTESAFRMVDVTQDGVLDVIFGFGTGGDGYNMPPVVCKIYFPGHDACGGGLMALDGNTGKELWRHYTEHEVYSVNCQLDLDTDGILDCLAAGRAGVFRAVSGRTGRLIWKFTDIRTEEKDMNLYTPQCIKDYTGDGIPEIVNIHGGDPFGEPGSKTRKSGKIIIFDGSNGEPIQRVTVPDKTESYYSPVIHQHPDGTQYVLFGTGGETHPGSLWLVSVDDLYKGHINKARRLFSDAFKGAMTPPVIVDVNQDGQEDIVFSMYNSTTLALDGATWKVLWNYTYPWSESYATPSPGFYNDDDVPDFMVKQNFGPGFPIYYHAVTTVLDGATGKPLLKPYIKETVGSQASPLTISMEGRGNDIFLYWVADCIGHKGQGGQYTFIKGTNVHEKSRSDFCRLRFKTQGYSQYYAINSHVPSPGVSVYYSVDRDKLEHSKWINTTEEAIHFIKTHPEFQEEYNYFQTLRQAQEELKKKWERKKLAESYHGRKTIKHLPVPHIKSARPKYTSGPPKAGYQGKLHINKLPKPRPYPEHRGPVSDSNMSPNPAKSGAYRDESDDDDRRYRPGQAGEKPSRRPLYGPQKEAGADVARRYDDKPDAGDSNLKDQQFYDRVSDIVSDLLKKEGYGDTPYYNKGWPKPEYPERSYGQAQDDAKQDQYQKEEKDREKRHVGPHDVGGLQRLISTGTLAPPLLNTSHPDYTRSMDVLFATYWFFPADTKVILPEDQECIDKMMKDEVQRFDPSSVYYGMDTDGYHHAVTDKCLSKSQHQMPKHGTYQSQHTYNPFNVHMGQMTVYRLRLKCSCEGNTHVERGMKKCARILPFEKQGWTGYMGSNGDSHWNQENHH